jgi:U3 small nucleolar RNA-associated protein 14
VVVAKDSAAVDKAQNQLKWQAKNREEEKEDAVVEISMGDVMTLGSGGRPAEGDDEDGANSEVEAQEEALARKGTARSRGVKALVQRDLLARAFAGDNVVEVRGRSSQT